DVNAQLRHGHTPLMLAAAENSDPDLIRLLLDAGADLETRNALGNTALVMAVQSGHVAAARTLLDAGAKGDVRGDQAQTPLSVALELEDWELVSMLLAAGAKPSSPMGG